MTMLANLASCYTPGNIWALQKVYKDSDYTIMVVVVHHLTQMQMK